MFVINKEFEKITELNLDELNGLIDKMLLNIYYHTLKMDI